MTTRDGILVILGMYRSGTSFLTETAGTLGFALPRQDDDAPAKGAAGDFEPQAVRRLNDRLMGRKGAWWARMGPIDIAADPADLQAALDRDFGAAPRIVIKDPRLSMLLPRWRPVLEQAGPTHALIALRHPGEVATSLARRDGIAVDAAYLIWMFHMLSAVESTEGMRRGLMLFPDWTDDIPATLDRIAGIAGVTVPEGAAEKVAARFQPGAVHGGQQLCAANPDIDLLAGNLFALLARHAQEGTHPPSADILTFKDQLDHVAATARDIEATAAIHIATLQSRLDTVEEQTHRLRAEAAESARQRDQLAARLAPKGPDTARKATGQKANTPAPDLGPASSPAKTAREAAPRPILRRILDAFRGSPTPAAIAPPPGTAASQNSEPLSPGAQQPDIFFLASTDWDGPPQRPQHLATAFGRAGHRVFFIQISASATPAREVAPNVQVIGLPPPADVTPCADSQREWIDRFHALADQVEATPRAHIVITDPASWHLVRHLSPQFRITVDICPDLRAETDEDRAGPRADMIAGADRLTVPSRTLQQRYEDRRRARLIRNGADVDHFIRDAAPETPGFLNQPPRDGAIRVGCAARVADRLDSDLLARIARDNPDFDIHLCGPVQPDAARDLAQLPNVSLHGVIPYAELPGFFAAMDVMTLPFRLTPQIQAEDPEEFYDHAAAGKPTVATNLPELTRAGDLAILAEDAAAFAQGIRVAAQKAQDPMTASALRSYALENAWAYRAEDFLEAFDQAPLLSVILLASEPVQPVLDCLNALLGRGQIYPALEVLLVDTGSSPATLEDLRAAASDSRIRLIETGQSLNFARAATIGLDAAHGEYVLFLNPHALVSGGALSAMLLQLKRNPEIGLIGPLSDEADPAEDLRSHPDSRQIDRIARELTTGYRGVWTPAPVDPIFCAMARKADLDRIGGPPGLYDSDAVAARDLVTSIQRAGLTIARAEDAFVHSTRALPDPQAAPPESDLVIYGERWPDAPLEPQQWDRPKPSLPDSA